MLNPNLYFKKGLIMMEFLLLCGIAAAITAGDNGHTPRNNRGEPYYGNKGKKRRYTHYHKINDYCIDYWDDNNKEWVSEYNIKMF